MTSTRTALFISPHLDDVAFSCAGTLAALKARGWSIVLATVFTRSVPNPTGFALACQTDKGLAPEVDYMALRRDEDAAFAGTPGIEADEVHWLDLEEAPHRGYDSPAALFGSVLPGDEIWRDVAARVGGLAETIDPDVVFAPQALGNHVDHRQTVRAVVSLGRPTLWYRDLPYATRAPEEAPPPGLPDGLIPLAVSGFRPPARQDRRLLPLRDATAVPVRRERTGRPDADIFRRGRGRACRACRPCRMLPGRSGRRRSDQACKLYGA